MPYPLTLHPDRESAAVSSPAAQWALSVLGDWATTASAAGPARLTVRVLGTDSAGAAGLWAAATGTPPDAPESFVVGTSPSGLIVIGSDGAGVAYALLELLDQLNLTGEVTGLPLSGTPSNRVRGVFRSYVSKVEDESWYLDRAFWDDYLTELATHRINRLQLAFGIGVEYGHDPGVTENYLLFSYPFLVELPDFGVRVAGLPDEERRANLDALRYASDEAARRGIEFFVGFWTQGIELDDAIVGEWTVEGVTPENHAAYAAAAIREILLECPGIAGVTLRVHYESGIPEPAEKYWTTVFDGISAAGRPVAVDLHSKGLSAETLAAARESGLDVLVTAKFLAEHLSLPYHQAAIRESELPVETVDAAFATVTRGARRFTRYGYADYLRHDRDYRVVYRHWPGTQRLLLWGDPAFAAGYSRIASFGGADGAEFFEPLAYKGRKGSGSPGGRQVYADPALAEGAAEWRKYAYFYRLIGRLLYDPDASPEQWRRWLTATFGAAGAVEAERALAVASRILPLVSVAHGVSAANSVYWPEMYENLGIANGGSPNEYYVSDSRPPHTFGTASSLDPEVFATIAETVSVLLGQAAPDGRETTLDVARRLDGLATLASVSIGAFESATRSQAGASSPDVRRWIVDVRALAGLGRFFAAKLRAGLGYELFTSTGSAAYLQYAVSRYAVAAEAWREVAVVTAGYKTDLAFGKAAHLRGHWADRQASIDRDVADLRAELAAAPAGPEPAIDLAALEAAGATAGTATGAAAGAAGPELAHVPPGSFRPGADLVLRLTGPGPDGAGVALRYRHANQAEQYVETPAVRTGDGWAATVPGAYTDSPFDLIYAFVVHGPAGEAHRIPGLPESLDTPPYFVAVRF
ncbi:hypothetical protein [Jiangella mangrovi]|uniref:Uncharacterized protein n=1 Tax=Jiangella mangrovi TaxID=1524084 RepID=A0A7W9GTH9_9ACTN|nr:hypothetical protein [Jiangella mangrovi]MBB5789667.1 hypothetical protein [Jiangella mangrovi]